MAMTMTMKTDEVSCDRLFSVALMQRDENKEDS